MIYFWSKAMPGLYYLFSVPKGDPLRPWRWRAKVERRETTGFYRVIIRDDENESVTMDRSAPWTPKSAMEWVQRFFPGCEFSNENF